VRILLAEVIRDRLGSFGKIVPGDFLNDLVNFKAIKFYDQPVENLLLIVDKFRSLIAGEGSNSM
jgi:hypothetical protein